MRERYAPALLGALCLLWVGPATAQDRAVSRLMHGSQAPYRSQIIGPEAMQEILRSNRLAARIAARSAGGMVSIPGGEFLSGDDRRRASVETPYRIDVTEVSNAQYRAFLAAATAHPRRYAHPQEPETNSYLPRYWSEYRAPLFRKTAAARIAPFDELTFRLPDNPVVGVDWWDAYAFCRWANKRLPSELEWEKAARGVDGRIWPWGDRWARGKANIGGDKWGEVDGYIYAAPVISFGGGASVYGVLNMAGNVAEWTAEGSLMGGSSNASPSGVRTSARQHHERGYRSFNIGFRCADDGQ